MIPCRSLPLDDEAMLYQSVFLVRASAAPTSLFRPPSRAEAPRYQSRAVCSRCGQAGHRAISCSRPLASIKSIEADLRQDTEAAARRIEAKGAYARDDFGPS
jgi:hypothetical protein